MTGFEIAVVVLLVALWFSISRLIEVQKQIFVHSEHTADLLGDIRDRLELIELKIDD